MIPPLSEPRLLEDNFEGEEFNFELDDSSPVLYDILRKSMYSDPIRAVVVELSSNSRDANAENNCPDTPIKIFLPGEYVAFSDSGIGISPERMHTIYRKFGASTKKNTNLQRGMMGLGAKTPLAYFPDFTVETVNEGTKYIYSIRIDETERGMIKLMSKTPTKQSSGTVIKVPVKNEDRWRFKELAFKYTQFWKVRPLFPGFPTPEYNAPALEGKHWTIYTRSTDGFNVLVDECPYSDTRHNIPTKVVLKFATGEVALSSSRESLQYNEFTDKAIKNALKEYDEEVVKLVETKLDTLQTFSEVLNVIETLPKAHTQRTWTWKNTSFLYPLATPITVYERLRSRLSSYHTKILDDNVTENSFLILDKSDPLTTYDRARIGSHLKAHKLNRIYLLEKTHTLPVKAIALSTIKVLRAKSGLPRAKRAAKTTVKGRKYNYRRMTDYPIETSTPIVYTTLSISDHGYQYRNSPVTVIQVAERDLKHVINQPKWFTLDEYINEEIYTKLTPEQIQREADRQDFVSKYSEFSFLVDDDDFKFFKNTLKDPVVTDTREKLIGWLVKQEKVKPVTKDIFSKYPLLNSLRYVPYDQRKHVIEYIKLVKSTQTQEVKNNVNASGSLAVA